MGFFFGIIKNSSAYKFDENIKIIVNNLTKKNIFLVINLVNESLKYVISIYVQRIKCCFSNTI